jgi:hypothetical protein
MPNAKPPLKAALIAQIHAISAQLDKGAGALKDLEIHLGTLKSLQKEIFDATADRNAKTMELLSNATKSKDVSSISTQLRTIEKSTAAAMVRLQKSVQGEGDIATAIANILKKEREKLKDIIKNVP